MVSMASEEIDDWHLVDKLLGEKRTRRRVRGGVTKLAGDHNEATALWSGLVGLAFAFVLGAAGSGLSLSRSAGYAKMVSMASEEMDIDDGRSVDRLLGEIGTGVQCAVALVVVGLKVRSSCCCRSYRSRCLLSIRVMIDIMSDRSLS